MLIAIDIISITLVGANIAAVQATVWKYPAAIATDSNYETFSPLYIGFSVP